MTGQYECVVAAGREASLGNFELGKSEQRDAPALKRTDGKRFIKMKIYLEIEAALKKTCLSNSQRPEANSGNPFYEIG